jgi:2-polyprenyl-6-methoxyphenol hydroxylase-like FAD-dependent oxidoreductase
MGTMGSSVDVVIVGGGIAGCALARAVANAGLSVVVLERQTTYRDKVRGEYLHPWGVDEAQRLGLEETLVAGGAAWITEAVGYDELFAPSEARTRPVVRKAIRSRPPRPMPAPRHAEMPEMARSTVRPAGATPYVRPAQYRAARGRRIPAA